MNQLLQLSLYNLYICISFQRTTIFIFIYVTLNRQHFSLILLLDPQNNIY